MPNRIIKESICDSESIDKLSWFEEVLFYRLIVNCDDYGRFDGRTAVIKNRLFPLKDNLTLKQVDAAVNTLATYGLLTVYKYDGKRFVVLQGWDRHQQIRAKRSKYPAPEDGEQTGDGICNQMQSDDSNCSRNPIQSESTTNPPKKDIPGGISKETPRRFLPPTVAEVDDYCREMRIHIDAERFVDFYTANGWKAGKNPMRDWKAAVRNWARRDQENGEIRKQQKHSADRIADMIREGVFND